MAGQRQPLKLIEANGRSHMTKDEIEERKKSEVPPVKGEMRPPAYLKGKAKKRFVYLCGELDKLGVIGTTDVEALARYVTAEAEYEAACAELAEIRGEKPEKEPDGGDEERDRWYRQIKAWSEATEAAAKRQDRFFKQAHMAAGALGLTISSRCRLVVPKAQEAPKKNKFADFMNGGNGGTA